MRRAAVAVLTISLALAGCTSDDDPVVTGTPTTPVTEDTPAEDPTPTGSPSESELPTSDPTDSDPTESESAVPPGTEADMTLSAQLTGAEEVPDDGDPAGAGTFVGGITMQEASGELCYSLEVTDLTSAVTAAHIHVGEAGVAGDVVITLTAPLGGPVEDCVTVNATELLPLMDNPDGYYVNVHSEAHPNGAVRGQLSDS